MPTVKELFDKYDIDYSNIKKYMPILTLSDNNLQYYTIENDCRYLNKIIINCRDKCAPIEYFDIEQILELNINMKTWNVYRWGGYKITEEEIINLIYEKISV